MFNLSEDEFNKNLSDSKSFIFYKKISSDLHTIVKIYLNTCIDKNYSFLFESSNNSNKSSRYSFICMDPDFVFKAKDNVSYFSNDLKKFNKSTIKPYDYLNKIIDENKIDILDENLPSMCSSIVGYMGYENITICEDINISNPNELDFTDDMVFIKPNTIIVHDSYNDTLFIARRIDDLSKNYEDEKKYINEIINQIENTFDEKIISVSKPNVSKPISNYTQNEYFDIIEKAKQYIINGDIFQVVLSQRFKLDYNLHPFNFYRSLRNINPSPYLFYMNFDGYQISGSSPELLVKCIDGEISIRPIAGTRKRQKTDELDQLMKQELLNDEKEVSEHLMLLDLGRNDVGKVSKPGTVNVTEKFIVEFYSHVMHIVSNVCGKKKDNISPLDCLLSGFPAGTVSGAPKIRAMEIIDELEKTKRNFYSGCVGYFSANGDMETCITLRTALINSNKIYIQAGAGIVYDSDNLSEYQECYNKAGALFKAAEQSYNFNKK